MDVLCTFAGFMVGPRSLGGCPPSPGLRRPRNRHPLRCGCGHRPRHRRAPRSRGQRAGCCGAHRRPSPRSRQRDGALRPAHALGRVQAGPCAHLGDGVPGAHHRFGRVRPCSPPGGPHRGRRARHEGAGLVPTARGGRDSRLRAGVSARAHEQCRHRVGASRAQPGNQGPSQLRVATPHEARRAGGGLPPASRSWTWTPSPSWWCRSASPEPPLDTWPDHIPDYSSPLMDHPNVVLTEAQRRVDRHRRPQHGRRGLPTRFGPRCRGPGRRWRPSSIPTSGRPDRWVSARSDGRGNRDTMRLEFDDEQALLQATARPR